MATEQRIPSKSELVEALRSSGREALERLRALPPDRFEQGRYENGWNAREILAHVASIEWTYPRLLDLARQAGSPQPETPPAAATSPPPPPPPAAGQPAPVASRPVRGGINDYNERQVEKRAGASIEELLTEFEKNRAATVAAVEEADEALFDTPIQSAGGITGTLATVLDMVAVRHIYAHVDDIVGPEGG